MSRPIPIPDADSGLEALRAMQREGHVLAALESFRNSLGDVFRVNLPGFTPVVMAGPEAARFVLVSGRGDFRWRNETDPVTSLLRRGVLVTDGEEHDGYRAQMNPPLHRRMLNAYIEAMWHAADHVSASWRDGQRLDMLIEMRKIALLIIMQTLYRVDFGPDLLALWKPVLRSIDYISPGLWLIWPGAPRWGFQRHIDALDAYLYRIISERRAALDEEPGDLLGTLIASGMDDERIRDQVLTMLIAGHDTSTANLAWSLLLLGQHPEAAAQLQTEADTVLGREAPAPDCVPQLRYAGLVTDESLRLYPPIHLGNRVAAVDIPYQDMLIPQGTRVIYSIYVTQRHPDYWPEPAAFRPERFAGESQPEPYTYLPFGGGPRNCIGGAFAQVEAKVVLSRLYQRFNLTLDSSVRTHPHMGATLEPRPGVFMTVRRRRAG